jgi:hypothetical protein
LCVAQGTYFLATGLWPLLHLPSFVAVTGPKTDVWLVKTVGVLIASIGAALVTAGATGAPSPAIAAVAIGSAAGLAAIDVWYVRRGVIRRVYLLDAVLEVGLVAAWTIALLA